MHPSPMPTLPFGRPTGRIVPHAEFQPPRASELPEEPPNDLDPELADPSDLEIDDPLADADDSNWDAFIPDDEYEPLPEPGDFWMEESQASSVDGQGPAGRVALSC